MSNLDSKPTAKAKHVPSDSILIDSLSSMYKDRESIEPEGRVIKRYISEKKYRYLVASNQLERYRAIVLAQNKE